MNLPPERPEAAAAPKRLLALAGLGYAAVLVISATLLYQRYRWEQANQAEVIASGGMSAAGDLLLWIFILVLFLIPTCFLVWVIRPIESLSTAWSRLLLGLSLSAPAGLGLLSLGEERIGQDLIMLGLLRLFLGPFFLLGMGASRLLARFRRAKRATSLALLIEGLTLGIAIGLLLREAGPSQP